MVMHQMMMMVLGHLQEPARDGQGRLLAGLEMELRRSGRALGLLGLPMEPGFMDRAVFPLEVAVSHEHWPHLARECIQKPHSIWV